MAFPKKIPVLNEGVHHRRVGAKRFFPFIPMNYVCHNDPQTNLRKYLCEHTSTSYKYKLQFAITNVRCSATSINIYIQGM